MHTEPSADHRLGGFQHGCYRQSLLLLILGCLRRTAHLVTIAAPYHGTLAGFFVKGPAPREIRTGIQFMAQLNEGAGILRRIPCTSLWAPFDGVILPASSSVVPWAHNQTFCAPTHADMLGDRDVQASVAAALRR